MKVGFIKNQIYTTDITSFFMFYVPRMRRIYAMQQFMLRRTTNYEIKRFLLEIFS